MANILIFSNNPRLIAECTHALLGDHDVGRLLNMRNEFSADAVIFDAKKLDDDAGLINLFNHSTCRFLVVGNGECSEDRQIDLLMHGAAGYCDESEASKLLNRAVNHVLQGELWIRRSLVPKVIGVLMSKRRPESSLPTMPSMDVEELVKMVESLSVREMEVANMIRQGENNKRIASALNISERTVKAHLSSIFRKLAVDDRLRLAVRLKEIDQFRG